MPSGGDLCWMAGGVNVLCVVGRTTVGSPALLQSLPGHFSTSLSLLHWVYSAHSLMQKLWPSIHKTLGKNKGIKSYCIFQFYRIDRLNSMACSYLRQNRQDGRLGPKSHQFHAIFSQRGFVIIKGYRLCRLNAATSNLSFCLYMRLQKVYSINAWLPQVTGISPSPWSTY